MASGTEPLPNTSTEGYDGGRSKQKKGFRPLKSVRKFFSRKPTKNDRGDKKSKSTSQLDDLNSKGRCENTTSVSSGLSRSHDDVFSANSEVEANLHKATVSMEALPQVSRQWNTSVDSEDEGLPRSPYNVSSTSDVRNRESRVKSASKASSSDNSLLSIGSLDEDESQEQPGIDFDTDPTQMKSLSSAAARHKISVRPQQRRRPRFKPIPEDPLPATPELPEDFSEAEDTLETSPSTALLSVGNDFSEDVCQEPKVEQKVPEKKSTFAGVKRKLSRRDKERNTRKVSDGSKKDESPGFFTRVMRSFQRMSTRESKSAPNSPTRNVDNQKVKAVKHRSASQLEGVQLVDNKHAVNVISYEKVMGRPPVSATHFTKRSDVQRAEEITQTGKHPKQAFMKKMSERETQKPLEIEKLKVTEETGKRSDDIRRTKSERIPREKSPVDDDDTMTANSCITNRLARDSRALSLSELADEAAGKRQIRKPLRESYVHQGKDKDSGGETEFSKTVAGITKRVDASKLESLEKKRHSSEVDESCHEELSRVVLRKTHRPDPVLEQVPKPPEIPVRRARKDVKIFSAKPSATTIKPGSENLSKGKFEKQKYNSEQISENSIQERISARASSVKKEQAHHNSEDISEMSENSLLKEVMLELSASTEEPLCQTQYTEPTEKPADFDSEVKVVIVDKNDKNVHIDKLEFPRQTRSRTLPGVYREDLEKPQTAIVQDTDSPKKRSHTQPISEDDVALAEKNLRKIDDVHSYSGVVRAASSKNVPRKLDLKDGDSMDSTPSWVLLAQKKHERYSTVEQENELVKTEKTEKIENKASTKVEPGENRRSSRVLEMVSNFQKLQ